MMDMKNTGVTMSLLNYENLKECQRDYKELVNEIKSWIKPTEIEGNSLEILINREKMEQFLLNFAKDCLEVKHSDHAQVVFHYE